MKRLLIVSRSHMPHGGADRIIADLCRFLPSRGWDVRLGLTQGARFNDVERYLDVLGHDLPAVSIDGRVGTRSARIAALRRVIRDEHPDVVLSMRVFDAYEAVIREKQSSPRAPRLAVGIRSFESPYLADLALYRDSVDLCVSSGELLADLAVDCCGMPSDRVVSIGGGVHSPETVVKSSRTRAQLSLLYAGRLDEAQKRLGDLPLLLDALDRRAVPFNLHIAGSGPADDMLKNRLATRIAADQVVLHGWVDQSVLYTSLYPQADIFLHFAGWEGMTIAPREAMANGAVPVISCFQGLRREGQFVDGINALVFPTGDIEAAADAVQRLHCERRMLERLSRTAMASQKGRYSFEGALDAWANALDCSVRQPARLGALPTIAAANHGRLNRWGIPESLQTGIRRWLRRPVQHQGPGSEWPTSSGRLADTDRARYESAASEFDARPASSLTTRRPSG